MVYSSKHCVTSSLRIFHIRLKTHVYRRCFLWFLCLFALSEKWHCHCQTHKLFSLLNYFTHLCAFLFCMSFIVAVLFNSLTANILFCVAMPGHEMSSYVRCYAKYLNDKLFSYRAMGYDFCKVKRGSVCVQFCQFLSAYWWIHHHNSQ